MMKMSVIIDTTVKEFMEKYPEHIAVTLFTNAWQHFTFDPNEQSHRVLSTAMLNLMQAANGVVLLVTGDANDVTKIWDTTCDGDYKGVTFH